MQSGRITEEKILWEIKQLYASIAERTAEAVADTASFGLDSIDSRPAIEITVASDKKFRIDIPEEELVKAMNVDEAVVMVRPYLPQSVRANA